jgi:hypothetical protein
MLQWSHIKEDLYHGVVLLRKGMLTAAVYTSQEMDRLKYRDRLQSAEREQAEAYRALGKYALMKLKAGHLDLMKEKEWPVLLQDIDRKRIEMERLKEEAEAFDREGTQGRP